MQFVEVAVDSPGGSGRTFSYSVPVGMRLAAGQSVFVPFGSQSFQGIIFELCDIPQVEQVRPVEGLIQDEALLNDIQLQIARWISRHYVCSLFDAASLMLPPGGHRKVVTWITISDRYCLPSLTNYQTRIVDYVIEKGRVRQDHLINRFGDRARRSINLISSKKVFQKEKVLVGARVRPQFFSYPKITDSGKEIVQGKSMSRSPKQFALLSVLETDDKPETMALARKTYGASAVKSLLQKGYIEQIDERLNRDPLRDKIYDSADPIQLVPEQKKALDQVIDLINNPDRNPRALLLHGVTGSGKTEIYLDAVRQCFASGRRAIVLVPEISLTPQIIEKFESRFAGQVAVSHSGLSIGERFDQWWKIRNGDYGVVIGSRSAIFVPQSNLGLIIIDEEHEWTYQQQERGPKYHVRDVAMQIAGLTRASVVLGSASPAIESYLRAMNGRYVLAELNERFNPSVATQDSSKISSHDSQHLASVQLVDMRNELKKGNISLFSDALMGQLKSAVDSGNQAILFLNRRGTSGYTQCRACGHTLRCRRCDITLTYHHDGKLLLCHYCGYKSKLFYDCPKCQGTRFVRYGVGTKGVAEKVQALFPGIAVIRWDRDLSSSAKRREEVLQDFREGRSQILVGTQMIAKGHHLPQVTFVGVILADVGLELPDFRANERTFQTLYQVFGRAGRGIEKGKVVVQTFQPGHYAIKAAVAQDYHLFLKTELDYRKRHGHPPFTRLIRILRNELDDRECRRKVESLVDVLKSQKEAWGMSGVDILGPTPAFPPFLRGRYRWQIILRGSDPRSLLDTVEINQAYGTGGITQGGWSVEVDPVMVN